MGVGAITLSLLCPVKKQQRPIKKKTCFLGAYYTPGPVLSTKHELSPGIIKTTLAQKSHDYYFTDGTLRLGVNMWGSSGLSCHSPQLGSVWTRWRTLKNNCNTQELLLSERIQPQEFLTTLSGWYCYPILQMRNLRLQERKSTRPVLSLAPRETSAIARAPPSGGLWDSGKTLHKWYRLLNTDYGMCQLLL